MMGKRAWSTVVGLLALAAALTSSAGVRGLLEKIMESEARLELTVVDEQGKPLDGASIWFFGDTPQRTDLRLEDLQRLVRRYQRDVDFIFEKSLHRELLIERTLDSGRADVLRDEADLGRLAAVRIHFAVLKRGWIPAVMSRTVKPGTREKITVSLKRDPAWQFDPRLEKLDHMRGVAAAIAGSEDMLTAEHQAELQRIDSGLRALAAQLTKDGRADDAAAVYYNLAYLPGVSIDVDKVAGTVTRQYTTGFDAESSQRVSDRALAWTLVRSRPALEYQAQLEKYKAEGLLRGPSPTRHDVRVRYIADTERAFRQNPEAMWPPFHLHLWDIYGAQGNADLACSALKAFFEFEPSYFSEGQWQRQLRLYEADVKLFGTTPSRKCELPGLSTGAN